jgi:hypothetical protein
MGTVQAQHAADAGPDFGFLAGTGLVDAAGISNDRTDHGTDIGLIILDNFRCQIQIDGANRGHRDGNAGGFFNAGGIMGIITAF